VVQTVTLPLDALNQIPGVSGVDAISFDIPQLEDIEDALDDGVPTLAEIGVEVGAQVQDVLADELDLDAVVDDITAALETELDPLVDTLPDEITAAVDDSLEDFEQDISGIVLDLDALADNITEQLEPEDIGQDVVSFESVFGALTDDIEEGFEQALDDTITSIDDILDTLEDIDTLLDALTGDVDAILELVEGLDADDPGESAIEALEEQPGGELLTAPTDFAISFGDDVLAALVSDSALDNLANAVTEFS